MKRWFLIALLMGLGILAFMYTGLSYADRLGEVRAPTLILAGRHDPEASVPCSEELVQGIGDGRLIIFEESGHAPFIEEEGRFAAVVDAFFNGNGEESEE